MMSNLSERDRKALTLGGYGVAAVLLFMLVGSPVMAYWDDVNAKIADREKKLKAIESGVSDAAAASIEMRKLRERARIHTDLNALNQQQMALMLQQVEALPSYSAISVRRLEGIAPRQEDTFYRSGVSLQFTGTLGGLHRFLAEVEASKPTLKVERLTVTAGSKDSSKIEGQMVIYGYAVVARGEKRG